MFQWGKELTVMTLHVLKYGENCWKEGGSNLERKRNHLLKLQRGSSQ